MNKNLEQKKEEIKNKLLINLFVEKYDTFKESIDLINQAFDIFNINYHYNYNKFCQDLTDETMRYIDENPEVDMTKYEEMYIIMPAIVMSLINKIKNEHGFKENREIENKTIDEKI